MCAGERHIDGFIFAHTHDFLSLLEEKKYSANSVDCYRMALRQFTGFLDAKQVNEIQDVTDNVIEEYRKRMAEKQFSGATVELHLRCIRRFFKYLAENQHIFLNPTENLIVPAPRRSLRHVPSEENIRKLLMQPDRCTAQGIRDSALLEIAYSTGLRREEMTRLDVGDADIGNHVMRVMGKGGRERVVPLGKEAVFWLQKYLGDSRKQLLRGTASEQALWIGPNSGRRMNSQMIGRIISLYAARAGLGNVVTPHSLRRACATHMLNNGADPVQIQMLLGHTSMKSLSQYLEVTIRDLKRAHAGSNPGK